MNFITNAIRYTPNKEDIIISTIDEKDRIKVCIENKGTHIEEEQLDKIWDRFLSRGCSSSTFARWNRSWACHFKEYFRTT